MASKAESARYVLARQLPEIRARVGFGSAQELADRVQELGGRLDRAAISKIESRTRNVSLDEALLLALALNVAPVHLFLPRDDEAEVQIASNLPAVPTGDARAWLRGAEPLSTVDDRTFRTEVPASEWKRPSQRSAEAEERVAVAGRRRRVAREKLQMFSDERGQYDEPLTAVRLAVPLTAERAAAARLDARLDAAYDEVAEANVDFDDAVANLRRVRAEEGR